MKSLSKQVYIYSLGTECFYTDKENRLHNELLELYIDKSELKKKIDEGNNIRNKIATDIMELVENNGDNNKGLDLNIRLNIVKNHLKKLRVERKNLNDSINTLKNKLKKEFEEFKGVRRLRSESLTDNKVIGIFDSALTRTIGMKVDNVSDGLIIVRAFYFNILEDIIKNGFIYNGEKYIYFSSSAGQIRTKKTMFIRESLWNKYEKSLTCGLSIEDINNKGGCNVNKLLAYKALISSASTKWNGFDINKSIVVPDLESPVTSQFDYIDRDTYKITRKELTVNIEHTDGCGMILPKKAKGSFMVRLPFVKGLLVPFAFDKFALECGNTKVVDIYGKEWDIIEDNIEVIFTKSQFKMAKYYADWQDYKDKFILHKCQANKLNEEDIGENATLNYQMLQTLTDLTDEELKILSEETLRDISLIGESKEIMLKTLGATKENRYKNHLQQALLLYPELLNDEHSKTIIKDKKKSMINGAYSGKLKINGKYLYLVPDLYAFCERLFKNIDNPQGLLKNGQVFTNIYNEGKVDILRSPHLYKEHAVREVIKNEKVNEWFVTQGIYTSVHDPISRILQFDNDGDKSLVIQDDTIIKAAERNMKNIVPLYYEMGVAKPEIINNENIYNSLISAFKANIGEVSNNITKIFNSSEEIDIEVVKWLTAENNYIIDFAKTLYMPKRPDKVNERIRNAVKGKVPYFFQEAKMKDKRNVEKLNNSAVNRLRKIIPNKNIRFKDVAGEFDYKMLMSDNVDKLDDKIIKLYRKLDRSKRWIIRDSGIKNRREGMLYVYKKIRDELKELEKDEDKIVNHLVVELFKNKKSPNKDTFWNCYGDIVLSNLRENLKGTKQCESCGVRIEMINNQTKYCESCFEIERRKYKALKEKEYRAKKRGQLKG